MASLSDRAEKADRFDFEATAKITDDLRMALVESGIADRIQRRVDTAGSQKGSGEGD